MNKESWEKYQMDFFTQQDKRYKKTETELRKLYTKRAEELQKEISYFYNKYGEDNVLEYKEMLKGISQSEKQMLYESYDLFIMKYPQYAHLKPVSEQFYKYKRLDMLNDEVYRNVLALKAEEQKEFESYLSEEVKMAYKSAIVGMTGLKDYFSDIDATEILNLKWLDDKNYIDRMNVGKEKLNQLINGYIKESIIRGDNYQDISKVISKRYKVGMEDSFALVFTEGQFMNNQANKKAFMDEGVEKYEVTAVMDRNTTVICRNLDGERFLFVDAEAGLNFPPFHTHCRTTTIPINPKTDDYYDNV